MKEMTLMCGIAFFLWAGLSTLKAIIRLVIEVYYSVISSRKVDAVDNRLKEGSISTFEGWMRKGDIYFSTGNNKKSIECYRKAAQSHPLNKTAPFRLGLALFLDDNYRGVEVEEVLNEALDKDRDYADAHFILGQFYLDIGLFTRAKEELLLSPEKMDVKDMDFLFQEEDEKASSPDNHVYKKLDVTAFRILVALYFVQFFLLGGFFFTSYWWILAVNVIVLLLQLKLHMALYEHLSVQDDRITYKTSFRSVQFCWKDILNVVRENEHRVRVILRGGEIRINRQWQNFEDIVRKIKVQLYFRKWRPDEGKIACE